MSLNVIYIWLSISYNGVKVQFTTENIILMQNFVGEMFNFVAT